MTTEENLLGMRVAEREDQREISESFQIPNLDRGMLYKRIAGHVRGLIESRELRPGDRLPTERELASLLGVSRVPIREAMRTLAAQGLIEVRRGRGMFVAEPGIGPAIDELATVLLRQRGLFHELFAVRRLLEPPSAQWAAVRAQDHEIQNLIRLVDEMELAGTGPRPDFETIGLRDMQLHVSISICSGNRVMVRLLQAIQDLHREQLETSLRYSGRVAKTIADHRRIVDAIAVRDPVEAYSAMVDHLANSEVAAMRRLEGGTSKHVD